MRTIRGTSQAAALAGLMLALAVTAWAQSTTSSTSPSNTPSASPPTTQPAPGTAPVAADIPAVKPSATNPSASDPKDKPAPGTAPVGGDIPAATINPDKVIEPGSQMVKVKPGSIDDVNAVGNREIGGRGLRNWYSTDTEIKMGRTYAMQIEKSTRFITDPVVTEYVNRIGQNIVKNSDCKVPFTIKVIDSDEINAICAARRLLLRQLRPDSERRRGGGAGRGDGP